jgi:hypothetical protein
MRYGMDLIIKTPAVAYALGDNLELSELRQDNLKRGARPMYANARFLFI